MATDNADTSIPEAPPFWRGMNVGKLMAVMIPLSLYFGAFHAARKLDPHELILPVVLYGLAATTGIVIAVRRRAAFREAIVQWSVPPSYFLFLSTLSSQSEPRSVIFGGFLGIVLSSGALVWRLAATHEAAPPKWPKTWFVASVVWGFVSLGYTMYLIFGLMFCLSPFVVFFFA